MNLIFGLGNPHLRYKNTPHNIGRDFVNWLASERIGEEWQKKEKLTSFVVKLPDMILGKSVLFMNRNGHSVAALKNFYNIKNEDTYLIQDELDLPWKKVKSSFNVSSAGHKGVESTMRHLGTRNFHRIRVGVSPPEKPPFPEKFLLSPMPPARTTEQKEVFQEILSVLKEEIPSSPRSPLYGSRTSKLFP